MSNAKDQPIFPKKPIKPSYATCSKCRREYHSCSVQECPHEEIKKAFGSSICMYCCRECSYNAFEDTGQACLLKRAKKKNLDNKKEKDTLTST